MAYNTLDDVPQPNERAVAMVRVDYNVPTDEQNRVVDDMRIRESLQTVQDLQRKGYGVVLATHFGRPEANGGPADVAFNLVHIRDTVSEILGSDVQLVENWDSEVPESTVEQLQPGSIAMLQNVRFDPGEKAGDKAFARRLAFMADIYVNDAFGTVHRAEQASIGIVPQYIESFMGRLMQKEVQAFDRVLKAKHLVTVMGGSKVSEKVEMIRVLLKKSKQLLVGGAMANTFLMLDHAVGNSMTEPDKQELARELLESSDQDANGTLFIPSDALAAGGFPSADRSTMPAFRNVDFSSKNTVQESEEILDIGQVTHRQYEKVISSARGVVWNGTMGVAEHPEFAEGSAAVARGMYTAAEKGFPTLIGGGDSAAFFNTQYDGPKHESTHVSTGGGAALAVLEKGDPALVPGIAPLVKA